METKTNYVLVVLKSLVASYIVTFLFLLILAVLLFKMHTTENFLQGGITITYMVSGFLGGFLSGKQIKERRFLWGLLTGVLYFLLLLIISLFMGQDGGLNISRVLWGACICSVSGMLGGMVS